MNKTGEVFPVESFIPSNLLKDARNWAQKLEVASLDGDIATELECYEELKASNEVAVYGFMFYARITIAKYYWISFAHKSTNYNKSEFYDENKYLEWLTETWVILSGQGDWEFLKNFKFDESKPIGPQLAYWLTFTLQSIARTITSENLKAQGYIWTSSKDKRTSADSGWVKKATEVSYNSGAASTEADRLKSRSLDREVNDALESSHNSRAFDPEYTSELDSLIDQITEMVNRGEFDYVNGNAQTNPDQVPLKDFFACIIDPETPDTALSTVNDLANYMNISYNVVRTYKWKLGQLFQDYDIDASTFMDIVKYDPDKMLAALGFKLAA